MYGALVAIGLFIRNASDSPLVEETLHLIDHTHVTIENGVTQFSYRPE